MTSEVSLSELIQRLHALGSSSQPAVASPSASLRSSPGKSPVSAFHIHPTFSPSLLSTVTSRAGLPSLTPPPADSQHTSPAIRHQQPEKFLQALLARHERAKSATATAAQSTAETSAPATPAASPRAPDASAPSLSSPSPSSSAAAGRALLHSLILRYTGSALPQKRARSPTRSASSRKPSPHAKSATTEVRAPSTEPPRSSSPPSFLSPSTVPPPSSSAALSAASRHHRQLFTRSSSSIGSVEVPVSVTVLTSSMSPSQSPVPVTRPKRSSSSAGSTARQRASVEVEKAQLKAAAEAARIAARATEMAASLLINATGGRRAEEREQEYSSQYHVAEGGKARKRDRLTSAVETAQPDAQDLLRLSSANGQQPFTTVSDTDGLQQHKKRKAGKQGRTEGNTATQRGRAGRKRKERGSDTDAGHRKRRSNHSMPAVRKTTTNKRAEERADDEYAEVRNGDTSGDSADDNTDDSHYSYDSEAELDGELSHIPVALTKADSRGASLLAASRSSSLASLLANPLMALSSLTAPTVSLVPVMSSGPTPLARTASRGGGRMRASPLLN